MAIRAKVYPLSFVFDDEKSSDRFILDNGLDGNNRRLSIERGGNEVTVTAASDIDLMIFYQGVKDKIVSRVGRDRYQMKW